MDFAKTMEMSKRHLRLTGIACCVVVKLASRTSNYVNEIVKTTGIVAQRGGQENVGTPDDLGAYWCGFIVIDGLQICCSVFMIFCGWPKETFARCQLLAIPRLDFHRISLLPIDLGDLRAWVPKGLKLAL